MRARGSELLRIAKNKWLFQDFIPGTADLIATMLTGLEYELSNLPMQLLLLSSLPPPTPRPPKKDAQKKFVQLSLPTLFGVNCSQSKLVIHSTEWIHILEEVSWVASTGQVTSVERLSLLFLGEQKTKKKRLNL